MSHKYGHIVNWMLTFSQEKRVVPKLSSATFGNGGFFDSNMFGESRFRKRLPL